MIAKEIKDQPAPFIYERLGEKYRYYFIDEFQDTSQMQWENLIPLIGNALEGADEFGNTGSLFLVGDAKQAIYRWRGGKAEQFLELATHQAQPFTINATLETLPKNYRSYQEIIHFNNHFFQSISRFLENPIYQEFFRLGNQQEVNTKEGGYVQISLVPEESDEAYVQKTLAVIQDCVLKGYRYNDICIIIRKKKHGFLLADYLIQQGIPIISSDSLLLSGSPKVGFLVNLLRFQIQPKELKVQYEILDFLSQTKTDSHSYIEKHLGNLAAHLQEDLNLDLSKLRMASVYDGLEYIIKTLDLAPTSDAHLSAFMDMVFDVQQKFGSDIQSFLDYWDKKGNTTSISMPENVESVQIMTIHKSKGLEFPVVLFPFANSNIFEEIDPKLWLPVATEDYLGFEEVLINKKQEVKEYSETAALLYEQDQEKIQLDAFNLLYVVLTRAVSSLFIISAKSIDRNGEHNTHYYSGLFINYLKELGIWEDDKFDYAFGNWTLIGQQTTTSYQNDIPYIYTNKDRPDFKIVAKAGMLWDQGLDIAVNQGNVIHFILGLIHTTTDLDHAVATAYQKGLLKETEIAEIKKTISKVIHHPDLKQYYSEEVDVFNERDILMANGTTLRPDRVTLRNDQVTLIDYKTGDRHKSHENQVNTYAQCFLEMGYAIDQKMIVYITNEIKIQII